MITTEQVLRRTTTYDILEFYTRDYREKKVLKPMDNFQNPLIHRTQKTPSFNISFWSQTQRYYYNDYGTGQSGSAFDLVMEMYGLKLHEACDKINEDMQLGIEGGEHVEADRQYKPEPKVLPDNRNYSFKVHFRLWESFDDAFWGQYGITKHICDLFRCYPISQFHAYTKENKPYEIKATSDNPLYFFQRQGWGKVYRPKANPKYMSKSYNLGKRPSGYLFGYEQLPYSGKRLFIVGGEKDVMSMRAHGYFAVSMNSEESNPLNYPNLMELIKSSRFANYVFMFDNDKTGKRKMEENALKLGCNYMELPSMPEGYKDISDWFRLQNEKLAV